MRSPSPASLKKVSPANLARLGADRLADLLIELAASRPDLKRRLRMELAAEAGAEHLATEIDKRLDVLDAGRSKVSWRQRPAFVRELEVLRTLISGHLARLDPGAALDRLWRFIDLARRVASRVKDKDGELAAIFQRAAEDAGAVLGQAEQVFDARGLIDTVVKNPFAWAYWLPVVLKDAPQDYADAALRLLSARPGAAASWMPLLRQFAAAAGDVDAYRATYTAKALNEPAVAADVAQRLLVAGRLREAGDLLEAADKESRGQDLAWIAAWTDVLEQTGHPDEAQAARWAAFERTLSADIARAFTRRLKGFDDVDAENRAFELAAGHPKFRRGLAFLMAWPALAEAARMIQAREGEIDVSPAEAEDWAAVLRVRHPAAANLLLRETAAAAFRRRDFATCDRLTAAADLIEP